MIYICEKCDFLFTRVEPQSECPFCERTCVREATEEEKQRFEQAFAAARRLTCDRKKMFQEMAKT